MVGQLPLLESDLSGVDGKCNSVPGIEGIALSGVFTKGVLGYRETYPSYKRIGHPNFMGVKLDGLRLSIGLNLPCAVPVATGCTIS